MLLEDRTVHLDKIAPVSFSSFKLEHLSLFCGVGQAGMANIDAILV